MRTLKQAREAMDVMDAWFDSPRRRMRNKQQLDQIRGAHAALAWFFGKEIPGSASFDDNIAKLAAELPKAESAHDPKPKAIKAPKKAPTQKRKA